MPPQPATTRFSHPIRLLFVQGALFLLTLALGLLSGQRLLGFYGGFLVLPRPTMDPLQLLSALVAVTLLLLLLPRFFKQSAKRAVLLKGLFVFAAYFGGLMVLSLWFNRGFLATLIMLALVLSWLRFFNALIHNLLIILAIAGAGAVLGLGFDPLLVVGFLIVMAVYDYIAVYKTKHMVAMARTVVEARAVFGFLVSTRLDDWLTPLKPDIPLNERFVILGSGDAALPLLLAVAMLPEGLTGALIVAGFSLAGLMASLVIFLGQKIKAPMPALPPIALAALIGYLIAKLFA